MWENKINNQETQESLRARLRIGILLFFFWIILMGIAAETFPFVQHTSRSQNVVYGLFTGIPFVLITGIYLWKAYNDLKTINNK